MNSVCQTIPTLHVSGAKQQSASLQDEEGRAFVIEPGSACTVALFKETGSNNREIVGSEIISAEADPLADWTIGQINIDFDDSVTVEYQPGKFGVLVKVVPASSTNPVYFEGGEMLVLDTVI